MYYINDKTTFSKLTTNFLKFISLKFLMSILIKEIKIKYYILSV